MFKAVFIHGSGNFKSENGNLIQSADMSLHYEAAIKTAVDMNHNDVVKVLFNYCCNSNDVVEYILKTAVKNGNLDIVQFILGTELCSEDLKDITIEEAVRFRKLDIVKEVFEKGVRNDLLRYLAKWASFLEFDDIRDYFIEKGVKIEWLR